ncbi:hypothetical protein CMUS01_15546 [Colletotrichum musicola]|uniref:Uncharacterized protein n=1 Tax=Colletotrichum musicola TaxID=2175873 RepID=A0A8H6IVU8_9PEZI|nr:hypothetical protein CMUS01_15546 [Colletotrichum musicola]
MMGCFRSGSFWNASPEGGRGQVRLSTLNFTGHHHHHHCPGDDLSPQHHNTTTTSSRLHHQLLLTRRCHPTAGATAAAVVIGPRPDRQEQECLKLTGRDRGCMRCTPFRSSPRPLTSIPSPFLSSTSAAATIAFGSQPSPRGEEAKGEGSSLVPLWAASCRRKLRLCRPTASPRLASPRLVSCRVVSPAFHAVENPANHLAGRQPRPPPDETTTHTQERFTIAFAVFRQDWLDPADQGGSAFAVADGLISFIEVQSNFDSLSSHPLFPIPNGRLRHRFRA